jgi:hypothetical protein
MRTQIVARAAYAYQGCVPLILADHAEERGALPRWTLAMFRLGVGAYDADVFIALGGDIATRGARPPPASAGARQTLQSTPPLAKGHPNGVP